MICPGCGKEMVSGYLYGSAPLLWSPNPHKKTLLPGKDEISLLNGAFPAACLCKDCRKVIVDY